MAETFRDWLLPQAEKLPNHPFTMHMHHLLARWIAQEVNDPWTTADDLHALIHGTDIGQHRILGQVVCDALNEARDDHHKKDHI